MTHTPSSGPFELVMVPVMSPSAARPGNVDHTRAATTSTASAGTPASRFFMVVSLLSAHLRRWEKRLRRLPTCATRSSPPCHTRRSCPAPRLSCRRPAFPSKLIGWSPSRSGTTMTNVSFVPLMLPSSDSTSLSPRSISPPRRSPSCSNRACQVVMPVWVLSLISQLPVIPLCAETSATSPRSRTAVADGAMTRRFPIVTASLAPGPSCTT